MLSQRVLSSMPLPAETLVSLNAPKWLISVTHWKQTRLMSHLTSLSERKV